jgi:hypothetical protein
VLAGAAFLVIYLGWRGTCLAYAAFHIAVLLPVYFAVLPHETESPAHQTVCAAPSKNVPAPRFGQARLLLVTLAIAITLAAMISTVLSVHLLTILQLRGVGLMTAVALGALVGPSQVGARTIEFLIARYHHPIWTKLVSTLLVAIGVTALWASLPVLAVPLVFYGAGIGLESIARGTLPLVLFAGPGYAATMGRLAMPSLMAQAAAPSVGAVLLSIYGVDGTLATLTVVAAINFGIACAIFANLKWAARHRSLLQTS